MENTSVGWVIANLRNPALKSGNTGNYISIVPAKCIELLGGIENTRKAIAHVGGWNVKDIIVHTGSPSIWGEVESRKTYVVERKPEKVS